MRRCALALVVLVATLPASAGDARAQAASLIDAAVVEREGAVEVWVRLTRPARYQAEVIDSPARLVVDFEDTAFRWTGRPVTVAPAPVRALRGSQFKPGLARVVVELRGPAPYTIERDREGVRIVFTRDTPPAAPASRPAPRASSRPLLYGVVMLDAEAHAYIFDPTLKQVRRYRVGDTVDDAVIETIGERHVVLRTPAGRQELRVEERKPDARPR